MGLFLQPLLWWIAPLWSLTCIVTYYVATAVFKYGEKSWLNFLGEYGKFFVCGLALGAAPWALLGLKWGILQALIGGIGFVIIKILDDKGKVKNPWVERLRGFIAAILV